MNREADTKGEAARPGAARGDARLAVEVLSLEYNSLRDELISRAAARQQSTTLFAGAGAALAGITAATTDWTPVVFGVAGVLVGFAVVTFVANGRTIGKLSKHVAQIEHDINQAVAGSLTTTKYMRWETEHQGKNRNLFSALVHGRGGTPCDRE